MLVYITTKLILSLLTLAVISKSATLSQWTKSNATKPSENKQTCSYNSITNELFIIGGAIDQFIIYDLYSDSITSSSNFSVDIQCGSRCYTQYNNDLYFVSNYELGTFDLNTQTMTYPLSLTTTLDVYGQRTCITISEDGNYIFIVGGSTAKSSNDQYKTSILQIYDIARDTLSYGPNMPEIRSGLTCEVVNNYLYAIAGNDQTGAELNSIAKLYIGDLQNIASESWLLNVFMPFGGGGQECIKVNNDIYIVGGYGTDVEVLRIDTETDQVYEDTPLPVHMYSICGIYANSRLYVVDDINIYYASVLPTDVEGPTNHPTVYPTETPIEKQTTETLTTKGIVQEETTETSDPTDNVTQSPIKEQSTETIINQTETLATQGIVQEQTTETSDPTDPTDNVTQSPIEEQSTEMIINPTDIPSDKPTTGPTEDVLSEQEVDEDDDIRTTSDGTDANPATSDKETKSPGTLIASVIITVILLCCCAAVLVVFIKWSKRRKASIRATVELQNVYNINAVLAEKKNEIIDAVQMNKSNVVSAEPPCLNPLTKSPGNDGESNRNDIDIVIKPHQTMITLKQQGEGNVVIDDDDDDDDEGDDLYDVHVTTNNLTTKGENEHEKND